MQQLLNGLDIKFEIEGEGKPLLFLHGWATDSSLYSPIIKPLSATFRVITVDLPGFGQSERPKKPLKLADYTQTIYELISHLNLNSIVIIGHSFGGKIALDYTYTYPQRVEKLILIAPSGTQSKKTLKNTILTVIAKVGRIITTIPPFTTLANKAKNYLYTKIGQPDYLNAGELKETYLNIVKENIEEKMKQINKPTLLLWGDHDTEVPLDQVKRTEKLLQGSTLKILTQCGHFPFLEEPVEFIEEIKTFVGK